SRRVISSASSTGFAPGRVDSAPMSTISQPSAIICRTWSMALLAARKRPPSKNESGVTLRIPMMSEREPIAARKASRLVRAAGSIIECQSSASDLFLTGVFAVPAHRHPFRMLADPLCNIWRCAHGALLQRCTWRVLKALIFAKRRIPDGTHGDHQFEQAHDAYLRANSLS